MPTNVEDSPGTVVLQTALNVVGIHLTRRNKTIHHYKAEYLLHTEHVAIVLFNFPQHATKTDRGMKFTQRRSAGLSSINYHVGWSLVTMLSATKRGDTSLVGASSVTKIYSHDCWFHQNCQSQLDVSAWKTWILDLKIHHFPSGSFNHWCWVKTKCSISRQIGYYNRLL